MTDSETIRRILLPPEPAEAQVRRDMPVILRMEMLLRKLDRSQRLSPHTGAAGNWPNRGNTGCP